MKIKEFEVEMERLGNVYGKNKYPPERIAVLFRTLGDLDYLYFKEKVSFLIATSDKPPMLNEFLSIMNDRPEKINTKPSCAKCQNTGRIIYEGYAYRCDCETGAIYNYLASLPIDKQPQELV